MLCLYGKEIPEESCGLKAWRKIKKIKNKINK
jgi:hypothetical protein